ncbi:MAG TPA: GNAT family N-acetyltransferase [Spirochaetia bacterium]
MGNIDLYVIRKSDEARAVDVLFEAFRNDPFFKYMLGARSIDARLARPIHTFLLNLGTKYGEAYAPSGAIEGVSLWLPPSHASITAWMSLRSGVARLLSLLPGNYKRAIPFARKMLAYARYSDKLHRDRVGFPHWYLLVIGVGDEYRGKGYASRLMRPMLERLDRERLPCYLETHNENNLKLYEHFGFEVVDEGRLPGSEQRQWAMLRNPEG